MKFLEIFNEVHKGDFALTDEAIYNSLAANNTVIPLYGGNKSHKTAERFVSIDGKTKEGIPITQFSGTGIIISLDGSAGNMTIKRNERFALNHHAGFFTVKENMTDKIDLEYFCLFYQNFLCNLSVSEGSKTLSLEQLYTSDFNLPKYEDQKRILQTIRPTRNIIAHLQKIKTRIEIDLNKQFETNYTDYQVKNIPIKKVFDCMSGNSGLTEEFIYSVSNLTDEKYKVLSSAIDEDKMLGEVSFCKINGKDLRIFKNKDGILVSRNGKAGSLKFLKKGKYTINDHAYILFIKEDCPYKIDLRWFISQYKSEFLSYSSNSDNGTWNKTGFFENVRISIPAYEEQIRISNYYTQLEQKLSEINRIEKKYKQLFNRELQFE